MKKPIPVTIRVSAFACVLMAVWCFQTATAGLSAESASPQSATDRVVSVSSAAALEDALARAGSGSTIVIAPGTYELTRSLLVRSTLSNLTIKGGSDNAGDVVLVGRGMANPNFDNVPHGIIVEDGASHITIANLTIRDVYKHAILLRQGTRYARIHNVRLVDAGGHLLKADGHLERGGSANTIVEYSTLEYTSTTRDANTGGIVVAGGSGWTVRQNTFRNIQAPVGQLAAPAVLMWQGSRDSIVEANQFMNCQREISLGLQERSPDDHARGVVRNNFIYRDSVVQGDVAILVADSPQSQVLHNTVLTNGSYGTAIEYRFANTAGTIVKNNLVDRRIVATKSATGTSTGNYTQALPSMFINAAAGNLHLAAGASVLFDQVPVVDDALLDFDGDSRQPGGMTDYGADERDNLRDPATSGTTTGSQEPSPTTSGGVTSPVVTTTEPSTTQTSKGKGKKPPVEPGILLPLPWEVMDIGGNFGGSASATDGTFTVRGGGADIAGNADQFTFVYQLLEGDGDLVARVARLDGARTGAKVGIMVRNGLSADAKYAASLLVSGKGLAFQTRIANGATTSKSGESAGSAPQWLKLVRAGDTFTTFSSTDGTRWTVLGTEVVYLDKRVYVGLAVASHSRQLATAQFTNVTVTPTGTSLNKPPTVAIATPSTGTSYSVGDQIEIAAAAGDADGSVTKVEFYAGSTLVGTSVTGPFRCSWSNVSAGRHSLKAVAYDNQGASAASAPVEVDVTAPANQPPIVSLSAPASGASYTAPASITVNASASDPDGSITKVEFFAGATRVGSDASSPYSVVWSAAPGSYSLTAVAWDEDGSSSTSAPVSVTVLGNQAPSVSLTGPRAGTTYTAPATLTFTATASDPDGSVARVEFLVLGVLVGSDSTSPYSFSVSGLAAGAYSLTARAIDSAGAATTSAPVSITVNPAPMGQQTLLFHPSADHAAVASYTVELFAAGANPLTAAPVRSQNIGKPTPVNGDIATDVSAMVNGLPAGEYFFSAVAIASTGASRSAPSATFVR